MRRQSIAAVCLTATLVVTACGGDDDTASASATTTPSAVTESTASSTDAGSSTSGTTGSTEGSDATTAPGDGLAPPDATLPPDIPAELSVGFAPVEIVGDPLPLYDSSASPDPAVGLPAPAIIGYDADGNVIHFDPKTDGPAMLVFLAHWCPHCNNEVPRIEQLQKDGKIPDGLNVIAVLSGSRPDAPNWPPADWIHEMGWTYPTIMEGVDLTLPNPYLIHQAYGVGGFPFVTIIDADGNVALRWSGEREDSDAMIDEVTSVLGL